MEGPRSKQATELVDEIFTVMESGQTFDYIGEPVTQLEHALQCANFARDSGASDEVMLAALFHDVGHFCLEDEKARARLSTSQAEKMGDLGALHHEQLGAEYLLSLGFSEKVADLVKNHVQAKRYLVWKDPAYYERLSPASKQTLEYQGGPMTTEEAAAFEGHPHFSTILKMRTWDEKAKLVDYVVPGLEAYKGPIMCHLEQQQSP